MRESKAAAQSSPVPADLATLPLFAKLPRRRLGELTRQFVVRAYPKGTTIAVPGDRITEFSVILSGRIQWLWRDEAGRQMLMGAEGRGGHFADVTLGGEPILMTLQVVEDLRVAAIPIDDLRKVLLEHPTVGAALLLDVVARLRRVLVTTRSLSMEDVYARTVKLLLARAEVIDGRSVARITHAEIGDRVGATREMVGRLIRDLARGGYIHAERGCITILRKPPPRW